MAATRAHAWNIDLTAQYSNACTLTAPGSDEVLEMPVYIQGDTNRDPFQISVRAHLDPERHSTATAGDLSTSYLSDLCREALDVRGGPRVFRVRATPRYRLR
jgi:hypothetical protein